MNDITLEFTHDECLTNNFEFLDYLSSQPLVLENTAHLGRFDSAKRWYPISIISEYFAHLRRPSAAWPYSYLKATHSKKFAKWLKENHHDLYTSCL